MAASQHHAQAQEWLNRRFTSLQPGDFRDSVHFCCTSDLIPPPNFRQVWTTCTGHDHAVWYLPVEDMSILHAIIIISSPVDEAQVAGVCRLVQAIDALGHDAPPILWVPHTVAPEVGLENTAVDVADPVRGEIVNQLLEMGLDAIVSGEPEGFRLALAVRSKIRKLASLSRTLNDVVNERRSRAQYVEYLKECVDCMLWDYLRIRLAPSIPPVDYDIPPGNIRHLDGYNFGGMLGRGMFGMVYRLHSEEQAAADQPQVVKVVTKEVIKELSDLKCMRSQIDVMNLLASPQWRHPSLIRLYHTYHSSTHLFFRMEFGGPENLYRRLNHRQKEGDAQRPLSLAKVGSLLSQAISVVTHLHLGPHVCHRDLKPENFIVQDDPSSPLVLKLADFDVALVQEPKGNGLARSPCGTIPFTAPEVLLKREYSGMAADIWSLGIVTLEVLCGIRVVEKVLALNQASGGKGENRPDESVARKIKAGFEAPGSAGKVLKERCRGELQALLPYMVKQINGMLTVDTRHRFEAQQVIDSWQACREALRFDPEA